MTECFATRVTSASAVALALVLAGCEGTHDLGNKACLPLRVPSSVALVNKAGLYSVPGKDSLLLLDEPRDSTNDTFNKLQQVRRIDAGTVLKIDRIEQHWGFDSGEGSINVVGALPGGDIFSYGWGFADQIHRAPWESPSVGAKRTIDCDG